MIFSIRYAVALLEKLCDSQGIDYSQEKKYWQERAQKSQEQFDAETAKRKVERAEKEKAREAKSAAKINENFTSSFD